MELKVVQLSSDEDNPKTLKTTTSRSNKSSIYSSSKSTSNDLSEDGDHVDDQQSLPDLEKLYGAQDEGSNIK